MMRVLPYLESTWVRNNVKDACLMIYLGVVLKGDLRNENLMKHGGV